MNADRSDLGGGGIYDSDKESAISDLIGKSVFVFTDLDLGLGGWEGGGRAHWYLQGKGPR